MESQPQWQIIPNNSITYKCIDGSFLSVWDELSEIIDIKLKELGESCLASNRIESDFLYLVTYPNYRKVTLPLWRE